MDHVEEMGLEPPRKIQDVQVVMSETAGKATRGRGRDAWRLEPEGETETPETKVVSNGVEGVRADPGRRERVQAKNSRRQSEAPGEEGEEMKSPKRKIIRVESEETQDHVTEENDMDQEEGEETSFVPSAISVPEKPLSRRDNQRRKNTLTFWQLASVVIKVRNHTQPVYARNVTTSKKGRTTDKVAVA